MKEKMFRIGSYMLVAALASFLTLVLFARPEPLSKLDQLERIIEELFIGEADKTAMEDAAADAMVRATGDRWSYYIPASRYESFEDRMNNAYVGIGVTIVRSEENDGYLVMSMEPGGPAEEAGMAVGDLIVQIDQQNVAQMTVEEVRALIQGETGSYVSVIALRQGEAASFSVERRKLEKTVADYELLGDNIGLVSIANFDDRCAEETIAAIETLLSKGAEKLIFDVRFNPGGYAHELVKVLDYLLPEGELFRSETYDGKERVDMSDETYLDMPMAVLVNGSSFSAAEFFAAALQEYEAAVVVGEPTTGKGYFQSTIRLNDGSAVALSTGKYFTPKGVSLAEVGITPDIRAVVDEDTAKAIRSGTLAPEKDPQVQAAVRALENQK